VCIRTATDGTIGDGNNKWKYKLYTILPNSPSTRVLYVKDFKDLLEEDDKTRVIGAYLRDATKEESKTICW
jgi:hypothetical protein